MMTEATTQLPTKTRELHNHHFDSTIWNDFQFRNDDIIIASYAKSGTTWSCRHASSALTPRLPSAIARI